MSNSKFQEMKNGPSPKVVCLIISSAFLLLSGAVPAQSPGPSGGDSLQTIREAKMLINLPEPQFGSFPSVPMGAKEIEDMGFEQVFESTPLSFPLRDGGHLYAREFSKGSEVTILLLHGVLGSSYTCNRMSGLLREAAKAEVIALDLRGHGQSSGKPGDVDYVGQYADDLADVIRAVKEKKPGQKIILAGHSMGGGILLRYAMRKGVPEVDGYLLFAPQLGHNAPTLPTAAREDDAAEPFLKVHISRMVGLYMLNTLGIHEYDSLPVLFFNLPDGAPLHQYSYRSHLSMAPEDFKEGLRAVTKPLLVAVGSEDEAFIASEYEPAVKGYSKGEVIVVEGAGHNGIRHSQAAMDAVSNWMLHHHLNH